MLSSFVREVQTGCGDGLARRVVRHAHRHGTVRILENVLGAQPPVAGADLSAQFRIGRIDEFIADTAGRAGLEFKSVEQIVFVAKAAEHE
jgi:hypothetical protein